MHGMVWKKKQYAWFSKVCHGSKSCIQSGEKDLETLTRLKCAFISGKLKMLTFTDLNTNIHSFLSFSRIPLKTILYLNRTWQKAVVYVCPMYVSARECVCVRSIKCMRKFWYSMSIFGYSTHLADPLSLDWELDRLLFELERDCDLSADFDFFFFRRLLACDAVGEDAGIDDFGFSKPSFPAVSENGRPWPDHLAPRLKTQSESTYYITRQHTTWPGQFAHLISSTNIMYMYYSYTTTGIHV